MIAIVIAVIMAALLIGIFGAVVVYAFTDPVGAIFAIVGFVVLALIFGAIEWAREALLAKFK